MRSIEDVPFIVGVGAQKAGTSWLHDYLKNHPDFCTPGLKELHYFDARYLPDLCYDGTEKVMLSKIKNIYRMKPDLFFRMCMSTNEEFYKEYFNLIYRGESALGEITPSYSMLNSQVYSKIASIHPETKFIFLMRNPADRLWSHIRHNAHVFQENIEDHCAHITEPAYYLRSDYQRTIQELYKSTGKHNILLMFYEELFCDESIKTICQFCGIDFIPADYTNFSNKGKISKTLSPGLRYNFIQHLHHVYKYVNELFAGDIPNSWKEDIKSIEKTSSKQIVKPDFSGNLTEIKEKYYSKISETLDLDRFKGLFKPVATNPLFCFYLWKLKYKLFFRRGKILLKQGERKQALKQYVNGIKKLFIPSRFLLYALLSSFFPKRLPFHTKDITLNISNRDFKKENQME